MTKMRKCYAETKDPEKALSCLNPTNTSVEARLLHGLKKYGSTNYLNALKKLPRNMLMLYVHAYQSFLWNQIASLRKKMGLDVLEGDLVLTEIQPALEAEKFEQDVSEACEEEILAESRFKAMARPLSKEDVESKKFTINDIVLSLPGHDIK